MTIPKNISLAGLKIEVLIMPTLFADKQLGGYSDYPNLRILLAGDIHPTLQEESLWHETIHFALFFMGEHELRENEKFVDLLAHFLHQGLSYQEGK